MKRILLVDTQTIILRILEYVLNSYRIETVTVSSGREALRQAGQRHFDLILLAVVLPDMDGFDVLRLLKQDPQAHDTPIIALINRDRLADKARALSMGVIDYLNQPFDLEEFINCVHRALMNSVVY